MSFASERSLSVAAGVPATSADAVTRAAEVDTNRLVGIDVLRAVGALMVLVQHGFWIFIADDLWKRGTFWAAYPLIQGQVGVVLFLVVSGFCIHGRAARTNPDENPGFLAFWSRRLKRLYPPYLAALALSLIALPIASGFYAWEAGEPFTFATIWHRIAPGGGGEFAFGGLISLLLLTPFWPKALDLLGNYPFWSLALEEQLYLLYFGLPWLRRRIGIRNTLWVTLAVSLLWRTASVFGPLGHGKPMMSHVPFGVIPPLSPEATMAFMNMGPSRWFEWVLGAMAVEIALGRHPRHPIQTSWPLAAVCSVLALACQWSHWGWVFTDPLWGVACWVVVNVVVRCEQEGRLRVSGLIAPLAKLGLFSYSLYLIHEPLIHVLGRPLMQVMPWPFARVLAMGIIIWLAYKFYLWVEIPAMAWSRGRKATKASA